MTDIFRAEKSSVDISGYLKKKGKIFGAWSPYYCELHRTDLYIRKDKDSDKIKHHYMITNDTKVTVNKDGKIPFMEIRLPGVRILYLATEDIDTLLKWAVAIRSAAFSGSMLSMDSFQILSVIGRGFFGKVLLVKKKETSELFALKTVKKEKLVNSRQIHTILAERDILVKAKHPFIVTMSFAFQTASKFYIGMEYVPGGDLLGLLIREGQLKLDAVRLYAAEIALAIEHLHSIGVVFRDLKPDNILIGADGHLKLTDFGLSKDISETKTTSTFCGTPEFIAPEVVFNKPYSYEVDWWSFGILVYQMLFGETPFYAENRASILSKIKFADPRYPEGTDPDVIDFINGFLAKNPLQRTTYEKMENHKFWNGLTRATVMAKTVTPSFIPEIRQSVSVEYFDESFTKENPMDSFATPMLGAEHVFQGFSFVDENAGGAENSEGSSNSSNDKESAF